MTEDLGLVLPAGVTPASLLHAAYAAADLAYVPYSHFPVGAAILTKGGRVIGGCNVENASYGLTICAERTAVPRMVASDPADRAIAAIAVVSTKAAPCYPCGACRQVLFEFGCGVLIVDGGGGEPRLHHFRDILPFGFGPDDLTS